MEGAPSSLGATPRVEEHSRGIDCPVSVLNTLRASVLEQFNSTPHGGEEITGVLFGTRNGEEVRIQVCCTGETHSDLERSDALTGTERAITAVITAARDRKELEGMEPVGWFRAHPRADLSLNKQELEIANALFPQLWQVALIMRPANSAATRVCFYFREREGPWTQECATREFTLPPAEIHHAPELPAASAGMDERPSITAEPPNLGPVLSHFERHTRRRFPVAAVGLTIAALAGAAFYYFYFGFGSPALGLSVQATDSPAQIRIAWDTGSRTVRNARTAYLEIADGGQGERMDLPAEQLQIGYVNHLRHANQVMVRMVVIEDGGTPSEEVKQFVAPPGSPPVLEAAAVNPPASENADGGAEKIPELVVPVPVEREEPDAPQERPKFQPPAARPARSPVMDETPAPPVMPPAQTARVTPSSLVTTPAMRTEPPPEKPAAPPPRQPAATPAQSAARPAAVRVAAAPSSGRVIWIGRLQKNQPVTIAGKTASTGTLIGELPGRAIRFSLSPGDLSSDGIVLYSSNMQYANSVVEPPGTQNGWNKTVYTWNPKFANDVSVDETPAAQNGWSRMVMHSRNPKISVIVIDWTLLN